MGPGISSPSKQPQVVGTTNQFYAYDDDLTKESPETNTLPTTLDPGTSSTGPTTVDPGASSP